jgi:hypothetical protein
VPARQDMEDFARLIEALHPWLDQVVVIGGWAHRLYRLHPLAQRLEYDPVATLDTDIAMPAELHVTGQDSNVPGTNGLNTLPAKSAVPSEWVPPAEIHFGS